MANHQRIGPGGLLIAFAAGAVVGAAIALLYAPASGEETREYLGRKARQGTDKAAETARQGREVLERQRNNLVNAFDRAREAYQITRDEEQDA